MDTKKLRQKILDLAIRGKLVPQDPNDEPASVLLERIRAERERLIKEGKIKRSKKTATDDDIEAPFEIPESWEWCKFGEYLDVRDGTHDSPKYVERGIPFVTSKNLKDGKIDFSNISYISEENHKEFTKRSKVDNGDILFAMIGSIGNSTMVNTNVEFSIKNVALFKPLASDTNMRFVLLFLKYVEAQLQRNAKGGMQPFVPLNYFRNDLYIPLPPMEEQQRIVTEVERWFAVIDTLESNEDDLIKAIDQAKSKILDLAIHGKLVPQDPNDEPAIELLKRINPKAEIITDNGHYQKLPKGWCLVKGKHIFNPMKSCKPIGETFKYIDIDAIDNKRQIISNVKILKVANAPSRASRFTQKGDVVFSLVRPYLRNIAIVSENDCIASTGFYVCHPTEVLLPKYCYHLMISDYIINGLNEFMKGDNSPSINKGDIDNWLFPIPPLAEQKRIVSKIEEIFSQFDAIETAL